MLVLSEAIYGRKVMSIHAGGQIATLQDPLIDPKNLKIVGFGVSARGLQYYSVLHSSDIREWGNIGVIVNSEDAIMEVDENMPKIKYLAEAGFKLEGIGVRTESGKRLGKVRNFVFETEGYFVVKLYVENRGILSLMNGTRVIERDSIVNVTKKFLVVSEDTLKVRSGSKKKANENIEYGFNG